MVFVPLGLNDAPMSILLPTVKGVTRRVVEGEEEGRGEVEIHIIFKDLDEDPIVTFKGGITAGLLQRARKHLRRAYIKRNADLGMKIGPPRTDGPEFRDLSSVVVTGVSND